MVVLNNHKNVFKSIELDTVAFGTIKVYKVIRVQVYDLPSITLDGYVSSVAPEMITLHRRSSPE